MNNPKYQILKNQYIQIKHPRTQRPTRLYRIYALRDIETIVGTVKAESIGGYIESEANLPQTDSSWVFNTAMVFDDAVLVDSVAQKDAKIFNR
jgi:hypothetical protein